MNLIRNNDYIINNCPYIVQDVALFTTFVTKYGIAMVTGYQIIMIPFWSVFCSKFYGIFEFVRNKLLRHYPSGLRYDEVL